LNYGKTRPAAESLCECSGAFDDFRAHLGRYRFAVEDDGGQGKSLRVSRAMLFEYYGAPAVTEDAPLGMPFDGAIEHYRLELAAHYGKVLR